MNYANIIHRMNDHAWGPWHGVTFESLETALFDAVGDDAALIANALRDLNNPQESTVNGLREMLAMMVDEDTYWSIVSRG